MSLGLFKKIATRSLYIILQKSQASRYVT